MWFEHFNLTHAWQYCSTMQGWLQLLLMQIIDSCWRRDTRFPEYEQMLASKELPYATVTVLIVLIFQWQQIGWSSSQEFTCPVTLCHHTSTPDESIPTKSKKTGMLYRQCISYTCSVQHCSKCSQKTEWTIDKALHKCYSTMKSMHR